MTPRRIGFLLVSVVATACGIAYDGPPPRFADAPPEPNPRVEHPATAVGPDAGVPDGSTVVVAAPDAAPGATQSDGAVIETADDAGTASLLLATGPLTRAQWDQMLEIGRRKFNRVCAECHGTGIGPTLNGRRRTADRVRHMARQGGGDMRPISQRRVSDEELESVIVFLTTIRAVVDVTAPPEAPAQ